MPIQDDGRCGRGRASGPGVRGLTPGEAGLLAAAPVPPGGAGRGVGDVGRGDGALTRDLPSAQGLGAVGAMGAGLLLPRYPIMSRDANNVLI